MNSLSIHLYNIELLFQTDVVSAYRHIAQVFRSEKMRQGAKTGLLIALLGPTGTQTGYRLYIGSDLQAEYTNLVDALLQTEHTILYRPLRETKGLTAFHAAWVAHRNWAIIMPGVSGSGKTGLCQQLLLQGCGYGSDEVSCFQNNTGTLLPAQRSLLLKRRYASSDDKEDVETFSTPFARDNLLLSMDGRRYSLPPGRRPRWANAGLYRLFFVFPCYDFAGPACQIEPLSTWDAVKHLLSHCIRLSAMDQTIFCRLVEAINPCYCQRLRFNDFKQAATIIMQHAER